MSSPQDLARQKIRQLATRSLESGKPGDWFETVYAEAQDNPDHIPWALMQVNPYLQDWLESYPRAGTNRSALVIGCGLGDDAEALQRLGFAVTAFDISPTAIAWCQKRFPDSQVNYIVGDLLDLPTAWQQSFDFVLESRNIQALPLTVRSQVIQGIGSLVAPHGTLLVITYFRENSEAPDGPPWPLSNAELSEFQACGLKEVRRHLFQRGENQEIQVHRIEYQQVLQGSELI